MERTQDLQHGFHSWIDYSKPQFLREIQSFTPASISTQELIQCRKTILGY